MKKYFSIIIAFTFMVFYCLPAVSENSPASLKGLKEVKVIFDVNVGNPNLLLTRLNLIEKTLEGISKYSTYKAVVAIRGQASDYMTKNNDHIKKDDIKTKEKIYFTLLNLKEKYGVTLEQCAVALGFRGIEPKEVYDIINVVENGYISIAGYQNQGYAFIPMD
ncbi:DsrE family protein [Deferribacteraceae bacterium V6Fe1]|nr:DsrE family protein [Deferribacteraceae bacterium V6Fe1]